MSISSMILGQSGTGKSTAMRNMNPEETLLIQTVKKPLPFKTKDWKPVTKDGGNIIVSCDSNFIVGAMNKTSRSVIIIDDLQYLAATEFMNRAHEKGYDKFTEMAKHYYDVVMASTMLPDHKRVYLLSHTDMSDTGQVKAKTIGKMIDEKITIEGLLTIVLRTHVINGQYIFSTRNNGSDTVKTPMGMFEEELIENDLMLVDKSIKEYYEIN